MKHKLDALQGAVYKALRGAAGAGRGCFVRLCAEHDALWVTDFPRAQGDENAARAALARLGVTGVERDGLWRLDLTLPGYEALLADLPEEPPPLPAKDALHPAYALCRLWLAHPAPLALQPREPLRAALKLWRKPTLLRELPGMHEATAIRLRSHEPAAHAAGRVLAAWLGEQESRREGSPSTVSSATSPD